MQYLSQPQYFKPTFISLYLEGFSKKKSVLKNDDVRMGGLMGVQRQASALFYL